MIYLCFIVFNFPIISKIENNNPSSKRLWHNTKYESQLFIIVFNLIFLYDILLLLLKSNIGFTCKFRIVSFEVHTQIIKFNSYPNKYLKLFTVIFFFLKQLNQFASNTLVCPTIFPHLCVETTLSDRSQQTIIVR